mmetsp:Transcript_19567/g.38266  ORF Transcript_19567/g.38266 Transcript_19567/m.38266 type:complete len:868 (+) Transcript_19567:53-2656(+)
MGGLDAAKDTGASGPAEHSLPGSSEAPGVASSGMASAAREDSDMSSSGPYNNNDNCNLKTKSDFGGSREGNNDKSSNDSTKMNDVIAGMTGLNVENSKNNIRNEIPGIEQNSVSAQSNSSLAPPPPLSRSATGADTSEAATPRPGSAKRFSLKPAGVRAKPDVESPIKRHPALAQRMPLVRIASLSEADPISSPAGGASGEEEFAHSGVGNRPRIGSRNDESMTHMMANWPGAAVQLSPAAMTMRRLRRGILDWASVAAMSVMEVLDGRTYDDDDEDIDNDASESKAQIRRKQQEEQQKQDQNAQHKHKSIVSLLDKVAIKSAHDLEEADPERGVVTPLPSAAHMPPLAVLPKRKTRRRTKIICAIGPASRSVDMILALLDAGMNVARLNFSHGDHEYHAETIRNLKEAVRIREELHGLQCHCAILMDTKGPEIRTGMLKNHEPVELVTGQLLEITTDYSIEGSSEIVACSYPDLCSSVIIGGIILIADGSIQTRVEEVKEKSVMVRVENDAILEERKNMNLPGVSIRLPGITTKDKYDLENFALKYPVDIVSGSFIRTADNVRAVRACLGEAGKHIRVHAKIESVEALRNIAEIIAEADGIHVSRGDLGMELPLSKLFLAQKGVIRWANLAGKPVVTSTQMLDSMTFRPRPTNAECSDVANAVLDGTDCVMLSAETAKGKYPREAVATMGRIISEAERVIDYDSYFSTIRAEVMSKGKVSLIEALASTAVETSLNVNAELIVLVSETGDLARLVAKYRPTARIVVVTSNPVTAHQMSVCRGVSAMVVKEEHLCFPQDMWLYANEYILDRAWAKPGAAVTVAMCLKDINARVAKHLREQPNLNERLSNAVEVRILSQDAYETMQHHR